MSRVVTGLEGLLQAPELIGGREWALLGNQAAVTSRLEPARLAIAKATGRPPQRLFAPEHGLDGIAQDMEAVDDEVDPETGARVISLYGASEATLRPSARDLADIELMVVDLPDIGSRHYTFAATMDAVMGACATARIEILVLDRPNPIGGVRRAGGLVDAGFESFVSQLPTPIRHGLTLGELALLLHRQRYPHLELAVVPCRGWRRCRWWDQTGLPWVPPSPNMPSLETATVYPGLCLVEATTLSEGRGTTTPFQLVGAPWLDARRLVDAVRGLGLDGVVLRAVRFRPQFGKHAGAICHGFAVHVTDRVAFEPVTLGLQLLKTIHRLHPRDFRWRREPYEFVSDVPAIDLLTGSAAARELIDGDGDLGSLFERWRGEVQEFETSLEGVLLYHE